MPSGKNIIAIFKKSYFLSELSSLISYEGYQIKVFKSLSEIIKNSNNTKILFIDFTLDKNLKELSKAIERTNSATKIFIFTKKIFNFENFEKEIHIINLPIVLRDFFKLLKKVAGGIDDVNYHIRIGSFVFFPKRSILASENMLSEINLTELENKFLEYLIKKKSGSTKNEILHKVWGHNKILDTHTLESLIYRLRRKIEENPNKPKILIQREKKYLLKL